MSTLNHNPIGHEPDTADVRGVSITAISLALGVTIVLFLVYGIFRYLVHHPFLITPASPLANTGQQQFPPRPRLQVYPTIELEQLHSREDKVLSTYGWVDKSAGIVRIPIDKAMELQLQRGFPARKETAAK